ncbi:DNA primase [Gordonia phage Austin]|nr:DNA primase [Gordonia phage Austin]
MSVNGGGRWDQMFAEINKTIAEGDKKSQDAKDVENIENIEVPEQFLEAAPVVHDEDNYAARKAEEQAEEDVALKKLNIVAVYKKLTGNDVKLSGGQNEKLVFCPTAGHVNKNSEAACLNTDKNTWVCYGQCEEGGGIIDMVAAANGMPFGKQLKGKEYAQAKQKTLEDFCGWRFDKTKGGYVGVSPAKQKEEVAQFEAEYGPLPEIKEDKPENPLGIQMLPGDEDLPSIGPTKFSRKEFGQAEPEQQVQQPAKKSEPVQVEARPASTATATPPALSLVDSPKDDDDSELGVDELLPEIDGIFDHIPEGTPLYEFMRAVEEMSVPKEFSLFRGLQLLSLSAGPYVRGRVGGAFKTTLSVLFVGVSGAGKSQSRHAMNAILDHIVYKWNPSPGNGNRFGNHTGIKSLIEPGSGEFLLQELSQEIDEGKPYAVADVMADLEVDELSRFMGKGAVTGSSLVGIFQEMDNSPALDASLRAGSRTGGTVVAVNPNLVFSAGVQPGALPSLIGRGNISNGFLARFEVVTGNKVVSDDIFDNKMKDMTFAQELYTDVAVYYSNKVDPESKRVRRLHYIDVDRSARPLMQKSYEQVEKWKHDEDIKSRFDLKLFKLATLFAINRKADVVMEEDIRSAMWLMEYLNRSTTLSGEKITITQGGEMENKIVKAVEYWTKKSGYATDGKIKSFVNVNKMGWDPADIRKRLEMLVERGIIMIDPRQAARGPRSSRYIHVDSLDRQEIRLVSDSSNKSRRNK